MAIYRNISLTFWEDNKVVDDFTYKDKYFLLYLLTNPHTNLIGCYEISIKQMSNELGLDKSEVEELLTRMEQVHKVILYAEETKEILIRNWYKYNWTKSEKLLKKVDDLIKYVKSKNLKELMEETLEKYRVSIGYLYTMDTSVSAAVSDSVSVSDPVINNINSNFIFNNNTKNSNNNIKLKNKNIYQIIEENFGRTLAPMEYEVIKSWLEVENISEELVVYATQIAVCNNACSVKYIERILQDWKRKNLLTLDQAKKENEKFKNKRELPDWWGKEFERKEPPPEKKKEIENLLKEFGGKE